jgi:hypothetical protein
MSRSLPVGADPIGSYTTSGTVEVYDPAMCCPTGVCGPGVDPALLRITRHLRWLQSRGVSVVRHGLAQEPGAFAANPRIAGLMAAFGDEALPATLVNGAVLAHGRYPTREELNTALAATAVVAPDHSATTGTGCCTPGSGCC